MLTTIKQVTGLSLDSLVKPAIILAVLLLSAIAGPQASIEQIILLIGTSAALVFLHKPMLGLVTLLLGAFLIPFSVGTGSQTPINIVIILLPVLLGLWLLHMVLHHDVRLAPSRAMFPLLALAMTAILSFAFGQLPWLLFGQRAPLTAQLGGLGIFLLSAMAFLLVAHQIRQQIWLQRLTWLFLILGAIYIAGRAFPFLGASIFRVYQRGVDGSIFWIWLVALAAGQAFFNHKLSLPWRLALGLLAVATLIVAWVQIKDWASGWFPSLIAFGIVFALRFPLPGALGGIAGGSAFIIRISDVLSIVTGNARGDFFQWQARQAAWQIVLEVASKSPLLGLGPANYYYYVQQFPILGYYVRFNSHNNYIDLIAQTGLLGLAMFLWFALSIGREAWELRIATSDGFARGYANACLGGLAGTLAAGMLGDWFLPFVYNIGLNGFRASFLAWFFLGGLVALKQISKTDKSREN
ncbi:MAG: hypothetical protein EXR62_02430 [Chloroflexi bacterium]|nr:hypothetical protein [Chloroflexota bacterium]